MKNKFTFSLLVIADVILVALALLQIFHPFLHFGNFALLNPQGIVASKQKSLMVTAVLIMLIVTLPVYFLLFFFAHKYSVDKTGEKYSPDLDSKVVAGLIWLIPTSIIFILGIINWQSTHELDPYKPINSSIKPITIQVVALQWKWLFIYPEENIATVNFIEFPENTPLNFELTADAPMSSFWIPQLGGQMYAMAGMKTPLHLMASNEGEFNGSAVEINGPGFSGMKFIAKSTSQNDFDDWIKSVKASNNTLSLDAYNKLAEPSENNPRALYSSVQNNLQNTVMMKFMAPQGQPNNPSTMEMSGMGGMDIK